MSEDDRWFWRNCRDIGISVHFWPLTWRLGCQRSADLYGGEWHLNFGPLSFTLSANIGSCSAENRFEAWRGLSEYEAAERAETYGRLTPEKHGVVILSRQPEREGR